MVHLNNHCDEATYEWWNVFKKKTNFKRHEPVFWCICERNYNVLVDEDEDKQEEAQTHCTQNTCSRQLIQRGYLKHWTFMEVEHRHWKRAHNTVNLSSHTITDHPTKTRPSRIVWLHLQQLLNSRLWFSSFVVWKHHQWRYFTIVKKHFYWKNKCVKNGHRTNCNKKRAKKQKPKHDSIVYISGSTICSWNIGLGLKLTTFKLKSYI